MKMTHPGAEKEFRTSWKFAVSSVTPSPGKS